MIIRTSDREALTKIDELIKALDKPNPMVLLEMKILAIKLDDNFESAFDLIYNDGTSSVNLNGWIIKDGQDYEHIVNDSSNDFLILPGEYLVFARSADLDANGGLNSDYVYSGISLSNSDDALILTDSQNAIIDEVNYSKQ